MGVSQSSRLYIIMSYYHDLVLLSILTRVNVTEVQTNSSDTFVHSVMGSPEIKVTFESRDEHTTQDMFSLLALPPVNLSQVYPKETNALPNDMDDHGSPGAPSDIFSMQGSLSWASRHLSALLYFVLIFLCVHYLLLFIFFFFFLFFLCNLPLLYVLSLKPPPLCCFAFETSPFPCQA